MKLSGNWSEWYLVFVVIFVVMVALLIYSLLPLHMQPAKQAVAFLAGWSWVYRQTSNTLQWRHNGCNSVSNHQPSDVFLNRLFRRRSKETSKLRITGLCEGNSPGTGEFPAQMASYAKNVSIWWRHYEKAHQISKLKSFIPSYICLCPIHWSQVLRRECRCSWTSADSQYSNCIWVISNFMAY